MFILLVDNNRFYFSVLKQLLFTAGFNTIGYAENGIECILQIDKHENPDVIIIDESQCFVDGVDIVKNIRFSRPEIRIIILTDEESMLNVNIISDKKSILYIPKNSSLSENLLNALYTIFTENLYPANKPSVTNAFLSFRESYSDILNS